MMLYNDTSLRRIFSSCFALVQTVPKNTRQLKNEKIQIQKLFNSQNNFHEFFPGFPRGLKVRDLKFKKKCTSDPKSHKNWKIESP